MNSYQAILSGRMTDFVGTSHYQTDMELDPTIHRFRKFRMLFETEAFEMTCAPCIQEERDMSFRRLCPLARATFGGVSLVMLHGN
jgi:hypothetical protein